MASDAAPADPRALLEQERKDLQDQLNELGFGSTSEGLTYDSNFADSSQVTAERGEASTLAANLREALEEVEAALVKLDEGNYGVCEGCGTPIPAARLEAMPAAAFCIDCASKR
ncbi:MAG TPA: TraR/DksA C4-type zinc finger protein [Acidimicrobiales bacterium]|nr:TraR/DksA C4-type zinc finger protein [Acidimicrobiales bacterium]